MLIIKKGNLLLALQAAIAFPGIFTPVRFGDRFLVDGGLCNPVPADVVRELGADSVIGVCAIPEVYKAPTETYLPPAEEENEGAQGHPFEFFNAVRIESVLMDILRRNGNGKRAGKDISQRKPPSLLRVCAQSVVIMENQINQLRLERNDIDLLIRPDLKNIALLDFHRAAEVIQAGETAAASVADQLRALATGH